MAKSPPNLSQQSLEEFEEFERLIRENTAGDSADDESDDSSWSQNSAKRVDNPAAADTGYHSVGNFTSQAQESSSERRETVSKSASDIESVSSLRSSLRLKNHHEARASDIDDHASEKSVTDLSFSIEQNPLEQNMGEEGEKLVATFGTTERMEALLQEQLDIGGGGDSEANESKASEEDPTPIAEDHFSSAASTPRVQLPQAKRRPYRQKVARSPSAKRVHRVNQKSRTWGPCSHSPAFPESSDDLSVHSDASRHELRQKLRKERLQRDQEKTITQQLQADYDNLVLKCAEAENTIDQLRIGAKIDLYAQLPDEVQNEVRKSNESLDNLTSKTESIGDSRRSNSRGTPRTSRDVITDNSLKLPAAANKEFTRIALKHQVNDLREHMEALATLLDEGNHIADDEKKIQLEHISQSLHDLEKDYLNAAREHDANKRAAILTGNTAVALDEFDPDHEIEGQIFQLGRLLENLKDRVSYGSSLPQTSAFSRKFVSEDARSDTSGSGNVDAQFNKQLQLYNKPTLDEGESDTTASSHFLSTDEETTIEYPGKSGSRKTSIDHEHMVLPDRFLRSASSSPRKATTPTSSIAGSSPSRSTRNSVSHSRPNDSNEQSPRQDSRPQPKSRLPRPVQSPSPNSQSRRNPSTRRKKSPSSNENDGDSGFIGSVSSKESMATIVPQNRMRKQELSPVHSVPPSERSIPTQSRKNPKQSRKSSTKPQNSSKASVVSGPSESDYFIPAPQSHSTAKKEHRRKPLKSEDGSSTWSVPMRPAPGIPTRPKIQEGATGGPLFSSIPYQNGPHHATPSHGSEKFRPDSRRSIGSRDSALDLIRGEIEKLRQELLDTQKSREAIPSRGRSEERKARKSSFASDSSTLTEGNSQKEWISSREGRSQRRNSKQGRRSLSEGSKVEKRDAKTGGDTPMNKSLDASNTNIEPEVRRGHWEYVAPYFSPVAASTQILSPRQVPVPAVVAAPLPQPPFVQYEPAYYNPVRYHSPARIYVPIATSPTVSSYPAVPVERTYRRSGSMRRSRPVVQIRDSYEENDGPLKRSHLRSPVKRSSSVPPLRQSVLDPQLNVSIERAERAADSLRKKSRSMYRSLRDSYNKAQLSLSMV